MATLFRSREAASLILATVGVRPPQKFNAAVFERLAEVPVTAHAVAVYCASAGDVLEIVRWKRRNHGTASLCVVAPRDAELLRTLLISRLVVDAVVFVDETAGSRELPEVAVATIVARSAGGEVSRRLMEALGVDGRRLAPERLRRLVDAALDGNGVQQIARALGMSEATLRRRVRSALDTTPKRLLRQLRVVAVDRLVRSGMTCEAAARAAGWSGMHAYHAARSRAAHPTVRRRPTSAGPEPPA